MGTTKRTISARRRAKLASEPYDAGYFARKHGITREQARDLMRQIGNDRDELNAAAAKLFRK
jgi:hypothetical protein